MLILEKLLLPPAGRSPVLGWRDVPGRQTGHEKTNIYRKVKRRCFCPTYGVGADEWFFSCPGHLPKDAHRDLELSKAYWDVISMPTCGDFSLLDLATIHILSPNILYRRTVEVNLCWSPGSILVY